MSIGRSLYFDARRKHICTNLTDLLRHFTSLCLLKLGDASLRFGSKKTTTPVTTDFIKAIIVVVLDSFNQFGQICLVAWFNLKDGSVMKRHIPYSLLTKIDLNSVHVGKIQISSQVFFRPFFHHTSKKMIYIPWINLPGWEQRTCRSCGEPIGPGETCS